MSLSRSCQANQHLPIIESVALSHVMWVHRWLRAIGVDAAFWRITKPADIDAMFDTCFREQRILGEARVRVCVVCCEGCLVVESVIVLSLTATGLSRCDLIRVLLHAFSRFLCSDPVQGPVVAPQMSPSHGGVWQGPRQGVQATSARIRLPDRCIHCVHSLCAVQRPVCSGKQ